MLSTLDRSVLDFERSWIVMKGPKDREIEAVLGLTTSIYYERLRTLIASSEARAYDPLTIRRVSALIDRPLPVEAVG